MNITDISSLMGGSGGQQPSALDWLKAGQQKTDVNVMKGGGDVTLLKKILDEMSLSTTPEGMDALIKTVFKQGFEQQMPKLLNAANTAGIRPQDATTQALLQNDLMARLASEGVKALGAQQAAVATGAGNYASLTEKPIVTKTTTPGLNIGQSVGQLTGLWS
jgi:hypothetical protein